MALIRRATPDDAPGICAIREALAAEIEISANDRVFAIDQQREYIGTLTDREGIFLAETPEGRLVGFQSLDLWMCHIRAMDHVAQMGTFVLPDWRRRGIGRQLAEEALAFARASAYEKLVVYVHARNLAGLELYHRLGFAECGRFERQVKLANEYDDEIMMELFL